MILYTEEGNSTYIFTVHFDQEMQGVYEDHFVEVWGQINGSDEVISELFPGEEREAPRVRASFCKW